MGEYLHKESKEIYVGVLSQDKQKCLMFSKNDITIKPFEVDRKSLIEQYVPVYKELT